MTRIPILWVEAMCILWEVKSQILGDYKSAEVIAYPELGPEAVRRLEVENFPVTVINDTKGNDLYQIGREQYEVRD